MSYENWLLVYERHFYATYNVSFVRQQQQMKATALPLHTFVQYVVIMYHESCLLNAIKSQKKQRQKNGDLVASSGL